MATDGGPAVPERYEDWILTHVPLDCSGMCREVTQDMIRAFPELRRVRGHYLGCPHWWCVTEDGLVIDPTIAQFPTFEPDGYVEHEGPEPVGKCYECGGYVFDSCWGGCCSRQCLDSYTRYLLADAMLKAREEP